MLIIAYASICQTVSILCKKSRYSKFESFIDLQPEMKNLKAMSKPEISKDIYIEDLVKHYPFSVRFMSQKGIKCIACGEPIWGTLEEAAKEKGFEDLKITELINEMKDLAAKD